MNSHTAKIIKRQRKHARIRARVSGTENRPRLAVFVSNRYVSVQLINDETGKTIASATSRGMKEKSFLERAAMVGRDIATKAKTLKVTKAVFDRGGFLYSGKVKAVADGAREGGLEF